MPGSGPVAVDVLEGVPEACGHLERYGQDAAMEKCEELKILRNMGTRLGQQVPKDSLIVTRKALRAAIEQERFEEAARLRDTLKNIYGHRT